MKEKQRQAELNHIVDDAFKDPNLLRALEIFQIGQHEYSRAISGLKTIKIYSGNSANKGGKTDAVLDRNQKRN